MKCHYEVLGLAREADDGEIKTAYRKLALRWHPDKNLENPEEAKEQFQLVQQAYEVLSDPHERAWYDNHREQILKGGNSDYQENCLDLFQFFTASCFKGYGDDPKGFYQVYAEVFEKIAAEDAEFMDDDGEIESIPKFGNSQSSYEEVVGPFYAYWQSYCTKKSYAWLCPYNISEIRDRRLLREIEKEQKKVVQKARRERNEEVRNLVSFIRKRDKRVQSYKQVLEERAALNRQKQEQMRLEQLKKRKQQIEELQKSSNSAVNEAYEQQLKQLAQEYKDSEDEYYSDDDDVPEDSEQNGDFDLDDLAYLDSSYCVACNKQFTNENAFLNHQSSKKHKLNVELIKESFRDEVEALNQESKSSCTNSEQSDSGDELKTSRKINKKENKVHLEDEYDGADELPESEAEKEPKESKQRSKKNKKAKVKKLQPEEEEALEEVPDLGKLSVDEDDWEDDVKSKKKQKGKKSGQKKSTPAQLATPKDSNSNGPTSNGATPKPPRKSEINDLPPETDIAHTCVTCKAIFDSKNKLFNHLKKTNHGVYIPKKTVAQATVQHEKAKKGKRNK